MTSAVELKTSLSSLRKTISRLRTESSLVSDSKKELSCKLEASDKEVLSSLLFSCVSPPLGFSAEDLYAMTQGVLPTNVKHALPAPTEMDCTSIGDGRVSPRVVDMLDQSVYGYIYQYFCAPRRKLAQQKVQSGNKSSSADEMIAFTQLYTPQWVVRHLTQQCLIPQWKLDGTAVDSAYLLRDRSAQINIVSSAAADLTVIDPACGTAHFLLGAYDLLMQMYVAEGYGRIDAAHLVLKNNLHGCDIDPIALWIAGLALVTKALPDLNSSNLPALNLALVGSHLRTADTGTAESGIADPGIADPGIADPGITDPGIADPDMGSLEREWPNTHPLSRKYAAVLGNPPYIGRKLLDRQLKQKLKQAYPNSHQDLSTAFLERGMELLRPSGRLGFIAQASMLFLPTYGNFREDLLDKHTIVSMLEAGPRVFPLVTGEKVNSMMIVLQKGLNERYDSMFLDMKATPNKQSGLMMVCEGRQGETPTDDAAECPQIYRRNQQQFRLQRKFAFNYRSAPALLQIQSSCQRLADIAKIKQGLATTDNARFLRWWWQVPIEEIGSKWVPYVKGGGSDRWFRPVEKVVLWENDGEAIKTAVATTYPYLNGKTEWVVKNQDFYGREGLTFSFVNANQLAVRHLPAGCIFDVGGSCIFPDVEDERFMWLAYLNSSFIACAASMLNPTINFQVGDLKLLPILEFPQKTKNELSLLGQTCLDLKRRLSRFNAAAWNMPVAPEIQQCFMGNPHQIWKNVQASFELDSQQLLEAEQRIDHIVKTSLANILNTEQASAIHELCDRETNKRKAHQIGVRDESEFARIVFASTLTQRAGQILPIANDVSLASSLGFDANLAAWLERALGANLRQFVTEGFRAHQLQTLHETTSVTAEFRPDGSLNLRRSTI